MVNLVLLNMCVYFVNLKYVVKTTICVPSNTTSIAERCYEIPFLILMILTLFSTLWTKLLCLFTIVRNN